MPNYADFFGVVNNEQEKAVLLSGSSIALLFTALGEYLADSQSWQGSGDFGALTDEERDTVDELIALTERELMTENGGVVTETGIIFMSPADRDGALLCDGTQYLRVDYPALYAFLAGTVYIVDADNFVVPDLMEVFVQGDETPGNTGGEATHVLTNNEMPAHTHFIDFGSGTLDPGSGIRALGATADRQYLMTINTSSKGANLAHNNMPPYHTMRFYIWT